MGLLYAVYAFVIGAANVQAGMQLSRKRGWEQWVGFSALAVAVVAFVAGFQSLMGFYVDPLMLLVPLVFAGFVIMVESWRTVSERGFWGWLLAVYNTFAWLTNVLQLIYLLQSRRD